MPIAKIAPSISDIFQSMSVDDQETSNTFALNWIKEHFTSKVEKVEDGTDVTIIEKSSFISKLTDINGALSEWVIFPDSRINELMRSLLKVLQKHENDLIEFLVPNYSYLSASKFVKMMIMQFEYYILSSFFKRVNVNFKETVVLHLELLDFPLIFIPLASALMYGCCPVIQITEPNYLKFFFLFLGTLFEEAGIPEKTYRVNIVPYEKLLSAFPEDVLLKRNHHYCPFVIFEDSDIDSTIESISVATYDSNKNFPWSLSHIYVQESVYKEFVSSLELKLSKLKFDNIPKISSETEDFLNTIKGLKMLVPVENCWVRFCVGWSPEDLNLKKSGSECVLISILPFRTSEEVVGFIKKHPPAVTASIWSERLSTLNRLISQLSIPTIWVNSYAIFHPSIPFESNFLYSRDTIADCITSKMLISHTDCDQLKNESNSYGVRLFKPLDRFSFYQGFNYITAIENARKAFKEWSLKTKETKLKVIMKLMDHLQKEGSLTDILSNTEEMIASIFLNPENTSCFSSIGSFNVSYSRESLGVVAVYLENAYELLPKHLNTLILSLLLFGNSVIVVAKTQTLCKFAVQSSSLFLANKILPDGIINIIDASLSSSETFKSLLQNDNGLSIKKILTLGFAHGCHAKISLDSFIIHIAPTDNSLLQSIDFLKFISTYFKCVWLPAK